VAKTEVEVNFFQFFVNRSFVTILAWIYYDS